MSFGSVDDGEAGVGLQGGGDMDAVGVLVVLQEGSHDAGQGEGGAVEGVAELGFLRAFSAVAALEAVGLIGVEVADGAYFQPTLLRFAIDFEVVADG